MSLQQLNGALITYLFSKEISKEILFDLKFQNKISQLFLIQQLFTW